MARRKTMVHAVCWCIGLCVVCFALSAWARDFEAVKRAAEQGDAHSQFILGAMHKNGYGVAKNEAEAAQWFRKAAEQGYADAQHEMGWVYLKGRVVAQDEAEAVKWFRLAAAQGHKAAQAVLRNIQK